MCWVVATLSFLEVPVFNMKILAGIDNIKKIKNTSKPVKETPKIVIRIPPIKISQNHFQFLPLVVT